MNADNPLFEDLSGQFEHCSDNDEYPEHTQFLREVEWEEQFLQQQEEQS